MADENQACENTDREIWREREGDFYADSIHVTKDGGIGINCGGCVFVKPIRAWFELAGGKAAFQLSLEDIAQLTTMFKELRDALGIDQKTLAEKLDCSPQFICDVEKGRRTPSVVFIDRLCDWLGRGPEGRRAWHIAAARAHGWKI